MNAYFFAATRCVACGILAAALSACGSSDENAEDTSGSLVPCDPFGGAGLAVIEYFAETADGRQLLVTRPDVDWGYEDFRLFFGTPERLAERGVSSVARQRDGGTTEITFSVDGADALAYFPATSRDLAPELTIDGTKTGMTLASAPAPSTQILCFSR